jgi:hypothetical protein
MQIAIELQNEFVALQAEPVIRKENPAFVRANEVHRLCGSPVEIESTIGKLQNPMLEDTLNWMLEHAVVTS